MKFRILNVLLVAVIATWTVAVVASRVASADEYEAFDDGTVCRHHHHGLHQSKHLEGRDPWFNCGCNGSYKFPVPPQYTYHWPGMYSQRLMTDYHSPWRFPPLRPYTDEAKPESAPSAAPKASTSRVRLVPVPR
jgi:hypothetical protein